MAIDKSLRSSYGWGGPGGKSPGSGGRGNGSADRGGRAHQATAEKAQKAARDASADRGGQAQKAAAEKAQKDARDARDAREKAIEVAAKTVKTETKSPHRDTKEQTKEQLAIDLSDFGFEDKKAKAPKTLTPRTKTIEQGVPHLEEPITKTVPHYYGGIGSKTTTGFGPKGTQTYSQAVEDSMKRGFFDSGIGKALKWGATALAPQLLGPKLGQLYSGYKQAKFASDTLKQLGLTKTNLMSDLTSKSNVRNLLSRKTTPTDTREDRIAQRDERDGRQVIAEAPKADVVTESVQKFTQPQLTELQKRRAMLQWYADKGALNERGQSTLMQLNQMLEQALVSVAHGGFIDKPLMGRSRDI
jgi:hypothetical protein